MLFNFFISIRVIIDVDDPTISGRFCVLVFSVWTGRGIRTFHMLNMFVHVSGCSIRDVARWCATALTEKHKRRID